MSAQRTRRTRIVRTPVRADETVSFAHHARSRVASFNPDDDEGTSDTDSEQDNPPVGTPRDSETPTRPPAGGEDDEGTPVASDIPGADLESPAGSSDGWAQALSIHGILETLGVDLPEIQGIFGAPSGAASGSDTRDREPEETINEHVPPPSTFTTHGGHAAPTHAIFEPAVAPGGQDHPVAGGTPPARHDAHVPAGRRNHAAAGGFPHPMPFGSPFGGGFGWSPGTAMTSFERRSAFDNPVPPEPNLDTSHIHDHTGAEGPLLRYEDFAQHPSNPAPAPWGMNTFGPPQYLAPLPPPAGAPSAPAPPPNRPSLFTHWDISQATALGLWPPKRLVKSKNNPRSDLSADVRDHLDAQYAARLAPVVYVATHEYGPGYRHCIMERVLAGVCRDEGISFGANSVVHMLPDGTTFGPIDVAAWADVTQTTWYKARGHMNKLRDLLNVLDSRSQHPAFEAQCGVGYRRVRMLVADELLPPPDTLLGSPHLHAERAVASISLRELEAFIKATETASKGLPVL